VKILCPTCKTLSIIDLPILLSVCACGTLIRAKSNTNRPPTTADSVTRTAQITHYEILGVEPSVGPAELKLAYRRKVKETHPDAGGNADDFKLVQMAWEILSNPDLRQKYDSGQLRNQTTALVVIPDLIGMTAVQAVRKAADEGIIVRVAIVEVESKSKLHGRAIGQFPYPDQEVDSNVVGIIVAISRAATIWQRIGTVASDLAVGFWSGLVSTTVGSNSPTREIGEKTTSHNVGAFVGETVGEIATGAVQATLGFLNCVGYILLTLITLIALAINPPLGLLFLGLSIFAIYRDRQKRDKRW
jgi:hypothetical protein